MHTGTRMGWRIAVNMGSQMLTQVLGNQTTIPMSASAGE